MVLHVVSLPHIQEICFYDDIKNIYEKLPFDLTLLPWEIDKVDEYLKKIYNVFNRPIDNYYIIVDWSYLNDIRKRIIEASKKYYIKNCRITSRFFASALIASTCISTDSLWVFFFVPLNYCCMLWEKGKNGKLQLKNSIFHELNSENIDPSIVELSMFKKRMNNFNDGLSSSSPLVVLHTPAKLKKENFFAIFQDQKDIIFKALENGFAHEFLQCIQHFYKLNQVFGNEIQIRDSDSLASFYSNHYVPFDHEIEVNYRKRNTVLKVIEGDLLTQKITFTKAGKWLININVDSNGIYTISTEEKWSLKNMFLPILTFSTNKSETLNVFNLFPKLEEYDASINAVGIDFGTSECCAFVVRKHGPDGVVLDPITKLRTMPTYATIGASRLCGQIVFNRIEYNVEQTAFNIKRLLGKNIDEIVIDPLWSFNIVNYYNQITLLFGGSVGMTTWCESSVGICGSVLGDIKSKIDEYQGCLLEDVVITIPSCYDERQKDATHDAAEIAGWKHVELLSEPIAAAFAYSYEKEIPNNSTIILFDCGGGTTDICIGKVLNEKLEILCENGDFFIGGNDFDKFLIDYFNEILKEEYNFDAFNSTKKYRLMRKCREIKHFLSAHETDKLDVDDFIFDHDDVIPITREIFEDFADTLIVKAKNLIAETLAKAKVNHSDIKIVYQVGGGCRVPMIKRMLLEIFPNAIHECSVNPEWMVAKGAALYSYFLKTKNKVVK